MDCSIGADMVGLLFVLLLASGLSTILQLIGSYGFRKTVTQATRLPVPPQLHEGMLCIPHTDTNIKAKNPVYS